MKGHAGMNALKFAAAVMTVMSIAACSGAGTAVQCSADLAQKTVVQIVRDQLEKTISAKVRNDDGARQVSLSKIRAVIAELAIVVDDIRTSKEDPNSSRRFCNGMLKLRLSQETLLDADRAREAAGLADVSLLADNAGIERQADSFMTTIEFNVQPTDDGDKVFAETESGNNMFDFAAEVLASALLRSNIEDTQRKQLEDQAQQSAEQAAALTEQRHANAAAVKMDNQLAVQTIGATWQSIESGTRARLLPQQRAWIAKKSADCKVEAASTSTNAVEKEIARLTCDTRMTQDRIGWLSNFRGSYDPPAPQMVAPPPSEPRQSDI